MKKQNAASLPREKRHKSKKTCNSILQYPLKNNQYQNSGTSNKSRKQGLQHIGEILDSYLPSSGEADGEVRK